MTDALISESFCASEQPLLATTDVATWMTLERNLEHNLEHNPEHNLEHNPEHNLGHNFQRNPADAT